MMNILVENVFVDDTRNWGHVGELVFPLIFSPIVSVKRSRNTHVNEISVRIFARLIIDSSKNRKRLSSSKSLFRPTRDHCYPHLF